MLADVDTELAQTTENTSTNASRSLVRRIDEDTFGNLQIIAQKDSQRALPAIEQFIVHDAERIERYLPEQPSDAQRQFVADRLTRRRNALEALHPSIAGNIPAPLFPTPGQPNEGSESAVVSSTMPSIPVGAPFVPPQVPKNRQSGMVQKGEPVPLGAMPHIVQPSAPGANMPQPSYPIAPTTTSRGIPTLNTNAPVATMPPPYEQLPQPASTMPVNTTQLFPHPESINGIPWASLAPEVRVHYYQEYLLRLQQKRAPLQMNAMPSTTTIIQQK